RVAKLTWDRWRWTIGGIADDAGIGDIEYRRVLAIDPDAWPESLAEFFNSYYPGTRLIPIKSGNDFQLRGRFVAAELLDRGLQWQYPTTYFLPTITDNFGAWRGTYYHNGLDLRSSWRRWGDEVLAAIGGQIIVAGANPNEPWFGQQVRTRTVLPDGSTVLVRYAHLLVGGIYVKVGDEVVAGQRLGRPGATGSATGDHLHIDIKWEGDYADPEMLIAWPGN
ncbi:M23 family metallopeptidase, partial [Thermogutta sp.]|uniref:M23 family metallopeptidase n=1 Tax=Thermogutta sp. TaxID=1962930 RepID=UPI0032207FC1